MSIIQGVQHIISANETGNSTQILLGSSATYSGAWEDVTNYTTVATTILGTLSTATGTLYMDLSTNGGSTYTSVSFNIDDITFDYPHILNVVETHVRIRYVNDGIAQTGTFSLQTKYSNGQSLGLSHIMGNTIGANHEGQIVKAVATGADPNAEYINIPASGVDNNNSTYTPLGIGGIWTGTWSRVDLYGEVKVAITTDVPSASCYLQLSHDGITVHTSLFLPPQLVGGNYSFIHALNPSIPYFRVLYTNGTSAQATFNVTTTLLTTSGEGFVSRTTQTIDRYTDARVVRQANDPTLDRNLGLLNYQQSKRKFGKNNSVSNASFETIWAGADLGGATVYTFATTAETLRVKAGGNAADTSAGLGAQTILVEGLSATYEEISETVTLAGASASAATTATFTAINKVSLVTTGTYGVGNTGNIVIENTSALQELAYIPAGLGNTQQSIFTVPAGKTAYVTKIRVSVGLSDSADIRMFHIDNIDDTSAPFTSVKHFEWGIEDYSGSRDFDLDTYLKFEEKNHIFFEGQRITGSGTAQISVDFEMYLVDNV